jgi:hypothetical protein
MVIQRGRRKKTAAEKDAELRAVMDKVLRIAAVDTNIKRNIRTLKSNKRQVKKLLNEFKQSRNPQFRKVIKLYAEDYQESVNKMAGFIKEDVAFMRKELDDLRPKGKRKKK